MKDNPVFAYFHVLNEGTGARQNGLPKDENPYDSCGSQDQRGAYKLWALGWEGENLSSFKVSKRV